MGKLFPIGFLILGVVLLVLGFQEYGAFGSKFTRAFGQAPSKEIILYFVAGGVCSFAGVLGLIRK